ncbi:hypothetical protein DSO57_1012353 [Entomophthora muscae]|uniref:Uncharacterized protein n=1 Tax=Entomophthora muscae TaxID=34485 RepID=A0ACC2SV67_9FUNG|nr:hypothetical protein DSO57_1012353 [Entomophthora muscae]
MLLCAGMLLTLLPIFIHGSLCLKAPISRWKMEAVRSHGCLTSKGWDHLPFIKHGFMGDIVNKQPTDASIWTGSPHNFTAYHQQQNKHLQAKHLSLFGTRQGKSISYEGFRVEKETFISEHVCRAAELCTLHLSHNGKRWKAVLRKDKYRIPSRLRYLILDSLPRFRQEGGRHSLLFLGPVQMRLTFTPILWGHWQKIHVMQRYGIPYFYNFCNAFTFPPKVNSMPDGWISYYSEPIPRD